MTRPERPSLLAQKVGAPTASPSAGQTVREGAREIRAYEEDPRRKYFGLLNVLSIVVPNDAEKLINEFIDELQIDELPEVTRKLMVDAIDASLIRLRRIEEKLERLRSSLSGGEKRCIAQ
jgi:hypothetical protein